MADASEITPDWIDELDEFLMSDKSPDDCLQISNLDGFLTGVVELHTLIEEPEDMNTSERGLKHVCPECATKYYDLKMKVVACPRCGAKPLPKTTQPARKIGRTASGRYR